MTLKLVAGCGLLLLACSIAQGASHAPEPKVDEAFWVHRQNAPQPNGHRAAEPIFRKQVIAPPTPAATPATPATATSHAAAALSHPAADRSIAEALAGGSSTPWAVVTGLTLLTLIPAVLLAMTPLVRLLVVFHFLRQALGTQTAPSNQVLMGLGLMMTWFLMQPVIVDVNQ